MVVDAEMSFLRKPTLASHACHAFRSNVPCNCMTDGSKSNYALSASRCCELGWSDVVCGLLVADVAHFVVGSGFSTTAQGGFALECERQEINLVDFWIARVTSVGDSSGWFDADGTASLTLSAVFLVEIRS